jgi:hypothetical protein
MTQALKVIYIVGLFRSGTTVLGDLLGQVEGCFHLGELRQLWVTPRLPRARCGCGSRFAECGLWQSILARAFGGGFAEICEQVLADERAGLRSRDALLLAALPWLRRHFRRRRAASQRCISTLHQVYVAAAEESGCTLLVDSSKWPAIAYALGDEPGIECHVVHIVRDARAVMHSWNAGWASAGWQARSDAGLWDRLVNRLLLGNLSWSAWNLGLRAFARRYPGRYLLLRYEDFMRAPTEALREVLKTAGIEAPVLPLDESGGFDLRHSHTVGGNPNRFRRGRIELHDRERWRDEMPTLWRSLTTAIAWPALRALGYLGRRSGG